MENYTTEERIEYLSTKIEYLVCKEPSMLIVIERMINGLCIVDNEVNGDMEKMCIMRDISNMKKIKSIGFIKKFTHSLMMKELN